MSTSRFQDRYGLSLTAESGAAVECYIDGVDRLLAVNSGAEEAFGRALEEDEGFALAHAALALTQQAQGKIDEAKVHALRAVSAIPDGSRRERQHAEVVKEVVDGNPRQVYGLIREHLAEFPRDALLLRQAVISLSFSGRQDRREESAALLDEVGPSYGDDWFYLSSRSFGLHERGHLDASRRLAEQALSANPRAGGAVHSLAHVFYETNEHAAGVDFLGKWMDGYDRNAPMHCHFGWHLALHELAQGHYAAMMERYDREIRSALSQSRTSMYDAASLLWRQQMYGCTDGPLPWQEVCDAAERGRPGMLFSDVHAGFAFAAVGDEAALSRLIERLRTLATEGNDLAARVALPLVEAARAFAQGNYDECVRLMEPISGDLVGLGGSNAQREVFEDTLIEACLRAGLWDRAEARLRVRLERRPSARDRFWLGRAYAGQDRLDDALPAFSQARAEWRAADVEFPELAALDRAQRQLSSAE